MLLKISKKIYKNRQKVKTIFHENQLKNKCLFVLGIKIKTFSSWAFDFYNYNFLTSWDFNSLASHVLMFIKLPKLTESKWIIDRWH